jgi:hypothetical protein
MLGERTTKVARLSRVKAISFATLLLARIASAGQTSDFNYSYQDVFSTNAEAFIVKRENVRKYREWQEPPVTYWGPIASGKPGILTMKFDFPSGAREMFLKARLTAFNWRDIYGYYGSSSLWASKDGTSWQMLLDCPPPLTGDDHIRDLTYNQPLPATFAGAESVWLQARMQEWNEHGRVVGQGQFSRNNPETLEEVFQLRARLGPNTIVSDKATREIQAASEPSHVRARWIVPATLIALFCSMLGLVIAVAASLIVLIRGGRKEDSRISLLTQRVTTAEERISRLESARRGDS